MQYTGAKLEKVDQNIPLRTWTRNLRICSHRRGLCRSVLLTNDWNSLTYMFNDQIRSLRSIYEFGGEFSGKSVLNANYSEFTTIFTNVSLMRPNDSKTNMLPNKTLKLRQLKTVSLTLFPHNCETKCYKSVVPWGISPIMLKPWGRAARGFSLSSPACRNTLVWHFYKTKIILQKENCQLQLN